MKNLGENSKCDRSGPTHRCNRTVYSISGAAPLAATGLFTCHFVRKSTCGATPLLLRDWVRVNRYIGYPAVSKNRASLVGEKSYVELDNQISDMARLRTEKKT